LIRGEAARRTSMKMKRALVVALLAAFSAGARASDDGKKPAIEWQPWSDAAFARARRENRLVILDLEAVWCHWCHVMDEKTYGDPRVATILRERFVTLKVDQDAQPDISKRYEDWGWPATIVFGPDGKELAKRRGYLPPEAMLSMLEAFVADPATPGPSVRPESEPVWATRGALAPSLRNELRQLHLTNYDEEQGSWGFGNKYVDAESVEYELRRGAKGDAAALRRARQTLTKGLALADPAWGGVYQYSTGGVWTEPHFEKIVSAQAASLRAYSLGWRALEDPAYRRAAREIRRYLNAFLRSPEGAYYVSQDADLVQGEHSAAYFARSDAERRKLGVPRVDTHVYARENGWVIEALVTFAECTGEREALDDARRAAAWVLAHRALPGGGFGHSEADAGGPYLADTLAMGRGLLALHRATGERRFLDAATAAARFIESRFGCEGAPGFASSVSERGLRRPPRDENALLARFAAGLARATRGASFRGLRDEAMRVAATPELARLPSVGVVLLADSEIGEKTGRE
jgi:uncharacterized protein YyaL (SSP411 family)